MEMSQAENCSIFCTFFLSLSTLMLSLGRSSVLKHILRINWSIVQKQAASFVTANMR